MPSSKTMSRSYHSKHEHEKHHYQRHQPISDRGRREIANSKRMHSGYSSVDKIRSATEINLLGRADVVCTDRLAGVRGCVCKDCHGLVQALAACWPSTSGKGDAEREVVDVGVGRGGSVCYCVCEA